MNLFEMPWQLDQEQYKDGGEHELDDEDMNDVLRNQFLRYGPEILEQNSRYTLGRNAYEDSGEYFLISQPRNAVTYYNSYEVHVVPGLGRTATQKDVWARNPNYRGIAQHVFLTYMLGAFDALMADNDQTPKGRDFWIKCMVEAVNQGMNVGIYDESSRSFSVFLEEDGTPFMTWLQQNWPWAKNQTAYHQRPFIAHRAPSE